MDFIVQLVVKSRQARREQGYRSVQDMGPFIDYQALKRHEMKE